MNSNTQTTPVLSFHGDPAIKEKYLKRVRDHQAADRLMKGATGGGGKGCAVACTLDMVYDHSRCPIELVIPKWLASLEDTLFEGMSLEKSKTWPEVFLDSIPVGVDLDRAKTPFLIMVLERSLKSLDDLKYDCESNPGVAAAVAQSRSAVEEMIRCHREGLDLSTAQSAAESARSAESAARSAGSTARSAGSAAQSASWSAESASWSAESAAWSASRSARSAWWSAGSASRSAAADTFDYFADELVRIFRGLR